jgi:CRISPR-associated protein Cmr4
VLNRFRRDAAAAGLKVPELPTSEPATNMAYLSGSGVSSGGTVVLEEFAFDVAQASEAEARTQELASWLAEHALPKDEVYAHWRKKLQNSLVILPQDAFRDFVLHATEVIARIRLEAETKTVAQGALWTEEHLPADSLLYAPIHATRLRTGKEERPDTLKTEDPQQEAENVLKWITNNKNLPHWIQMGGDETVGRGIVRLRWAGGAE